MQNKGVGNNGFSEGMNTDGHPLTIKDTQTIDTLNGEIITISDNQFLLQNIPGNDNKFNLSTIKVDDVYYNFRPLAVKVYDRVAYIVSGAFKEDGSFIAGELGTFPSPDWSVFNSNATEEDGEGKPTIISEVEEFQLTELTTGDFGVEYINRVTFGDDIIGKTARIGVKIKDDADDAESYLLKSYPEGCSTELTPSLNTVNKEEWSSVQLFNVPKSVYKFGYRKVMPKEDSFNKLYSGCLFDIDYRPTYNQPDKFEYGPIDWTSDGIYAWLAIAAIVKEFDENNFIGNITTTTVKSGYSINVDEISTLSVFNLEDNLTISSVNMSSESVENISSDIDLSVIKDFYTHILDGEYNLVTPLKTLPTKIKFILPYFLKAMNGDYNDDITELRALMIGKLPTDLEKNSAQDIIDFEIALSNWKLEEDSPRFRAIVEYEMTDGDDHDINSIIYGGKNSSVAMCSGKHDDSDWYDWIIGIIGGNLFKCKTAGKEYINSKKCLKAINALEILYDEDREDLAAEMEELEQRIDKSVPDNFDLDRSLVMIEMRDIEIYSEDTLEFKSISYVDLGEKGTVEAPLLNVYSPLKNFLTAEYGETIDDNDYLVDSNYIMPFRSAKFNFNIVDFVDLILQREYDKSINFIFTDDRNPIKLINSRFFINENGRAVFVDRRNLKDSNVYSNKYFDKTDLLLKIKNVPKLYFKGVKESGSLLGGGYRYFFRLMTVEGNVSDIIEESRLVSIFRGEGKGSYGVDGTVITDKSVSFRLSNLDPSYTQVQVSYTHSYGTDSLVNVVKVIRSGYKIDSGGSCDIIHTGYEITDIVEENTVSQEFSDIATAKTLTQVNNRLVIGNISSKLNDELFNLLSDLSSKITIGEEVTSTSDGYENPDNSYYNLGYWRGETYELAIVYVFKDSGASTPAFPIRGIDNLLGDAEYTDIDIPDYVGETFENVLGVYRTAFDGDVYKDGDRKVLKLTADVDAIISTTESLFLDNISSFYFVRKPRKKDILYQGYLIPSVLIPTENVNRPTSYKYPGWNRNTSYYGDGIFGYEPGVSKLSDQFSFTAVPMPSVSFPLIDHVELPIESDLNVNAEQKLAMIYSNDVQVDKVGVASSIDLTTRSIGISQEWIKVEGSLGKFDPIHLRSTVTQSLDDLIVQSVDLEFKNGGERSYGDNSFSSYIDRSLSYITTEADTDYDPSPGYSRKYMVEVDISSWRAHEITSTSGNNGNDDLAFEGWGINSSNNWTKSTSTDNFRNAMWQYASMVTKYTDYIGIRAKDDENISLRYWGALTYYVSSGASKYSTYKLVNIFSGDGIKSGNDLIAAYKTQDGIGYNTISERFELTKDNKIVSLGDGDCFITKVFKKTTYAPGIEGAPQVSIAQRKTYGIGPTKDYSDVIKSGPGSNDTVQTTFTNAKAYESDDAGRALTPQGIFLEMVMQSNHNADVRSVEYGDPAERDIYGNGRSFYPKRSIEQLRSEYRPDTSEYNLGLTGGFKIVTHAVIDNDAPIYSLKYPNRVVVSAPNISSEFFNGFRNIAGLNYRDYNSELGQIQKLIEHKNFLYVVFDSGVGVITVDGRTLISKSEEIFIDHAKVLNDKAFIISTDIGSKNPESIVSTLNTVYGVDYTLNKVWRVAGKALEIISDYSINSILIDWRKNLNLEPDPTFNYLGPVKIYLSYDKAKKNVVMSYSKLYKSTGTYNTSGSIYYSEILNKWISRLSYLSKFQFGIGDKNLMFDVNIENKAFEMDSTIVDRCNFNGVPYKFEFEFVMREKPDIEKILTNLQILSNKIKPNEISYEITGDVSDATISQENNPSSIILNEKIVTRGTSAIGIFSENAYYKDGKYFIQVGKDTSFSKFNKSARRVRDKYFKIRIKYTGESYVYLYTILSLFTNNYD